MLRILLSLLSVTISLSQLSAQSLPECPLYDSPQNGTTISSSVTARLTWYSGDSPTSYDIYLWTGSVVPTTPVANTVFVSYDASGLIPATTYKWFVVPKNSYGAATGCTSPVSFTTAPATPANDECNGALPVIPGNGPDCSVTLTTIGDNNGATQSMPGCAGSAEDDIWFKFTATSARHKIRVMTISPINPVVEIFSGVCSSLTSIGCYSNASVSYNNLTVDMAIFIPGQTYYYRVYGGTVNNARSVIQTCIATVPVGPSNDECTGAISLTANADTSSVYSYDGNMGYASQSLPSCVDIRFTAADTWFKFVATATTHKIALIPFSSQYDYAFQVYSGSCSNLISLSCINNAGYGIADTTTINNLTIGNSYYIRVYDYHGDGNPSQRFKIIINTTAAATPKPGTGNGLLGVYYDGVNLSGAPLLTRTDTAINFELTYGSHPQVLSPAPGIVPEDLYSVRWTGQVQPLFTETYTFSTLSDDGIRLWVNGVKLVDNWVNQGATENSGSITLVAGQKYDLVIEYYENTGDAVTKLYWYSASTAKAIIPKSQLYSAVIPPVATGNGTGLLGIYYNGTGLSGSPLLLRTDSTINFELTYGSHPQVLSPAPGVVPEDLYSVRWTGQVQPLYSETYTFSTLSDDGIRLWVNGVKLVDNWVNQGATENSGSIALLAGQKYNIAIEYYENTGDAVTKLYWSSLSTAKAIIPVRQLYPPNSGGETDEGAVTASSMSAVISPNPVKRGQPVNMQIISDKTATVGFNIIGSNGHIISKQQLNLVKGLNTKTINTTALPQGLYIISLSDGKKPLIMKWLVQ